MVLYVKVNQEEMSQLQPPQAALSQRMGTVMIVDDEMMVTSSLQTMLSLETTHRIHCFNSPLDALAQVETLRPDVIISDFSMPGMDGIAFLREVKKILPEATTILLTGYADKENAIQAINSVGIYRYIEKPWDNQELKLSIHNGLERSHLIGDLQQSVRELSEARAELERTNRHLEQLVEERTHDLRATYQKLQSIVQNTADGIITLDQSLRVTAINPAAEGWLKASDQAPDGQKDSALGMAIEKLLKPSAEHGKPTPIRQLFSSSQAHRVAEVLIGELPLEASIAPLVIPSEGLSEDGPLPASDGFVVVLRDITARKEIERLRDDFVSTLTHDLRTPLLAAIQTLGFFADGTLGELSSRQHELIAMLIQSNRELLGLVNVLLEVYKYESGRQKLILDTVNLAELIGGIGQELQALAQNREQSLLLDFADSNGRPEPYQVRGDKQELKRVFVNLIGNAINFTPKGGQISVSVSLLGDDSSSAHTNKNGKSHIRVCVTDTGRGIPAQDLPLLFQRFSQGTSKQRSSGSGLGLYLSRQIVEAHHGAIWVESEENRGSQFFVKLPQLS
jgi:signal transduction histidine kinase/FixJ family two-component response regulator